MHPAAYVSSKQGMQDRNHHRSCRGPSVWPQIARCFYDGCEVQPGSGQSVAARSTFILRERAPRCPFLDELIQALREKAGGNSRHAAMDLAELRDKPSRRRLTISTVHRLAQQFGRQSQGTILAISARHPAHCLKQETSRQLQIFVEWLRRSVRSEDEFPP